MSECDTPLEGRDHAAYGTPVKGREGFELLTVLDVKYGHRGRLSSGCGTILPLLDQGPPLHGPIGREDTRVGQGCVEEGPQHAIWLFLQRCRDHRRPVVRDTMKDDLKEGAKVGAVFRTAFRAI